MNDIFNPYIGLIIIDDALLYSKAIDLVVSAKKMNLFQIIIDANPIEKLWDPHLI